MTDFRIISGRVERFTELYRGEPFCGVLCDPPYGLSFMGKGWDHGVPGREIWEGVLRHLLPGAPLMAFGGSRTHHRLWCAIEDAGFELRDTLMWTYGEGFPKNHSLSKAIDKHLGAEREVVDTKLSAVPHAQGKGWGNPGVDNWRDEKQGAQPMDVTVPATAEAQQWDGRGTALKPAVEPICLAQRPPEGTYAENALKHGVAGLNVDGGRIETGEELRAGGPMRPLAGDTREGASLGFFDGAERDYDPRGGRWPANLILSHTADCVKVGVRQVKNKSGSVPADAPSRPAKNTYGEYNRGRDFERYGGEDGVETVDVWECAEDCPVRMLDEQSGESVSSGGGGTKVTGVNVYGDYQGHFYEGNVGFGDAGTAARFFYQAKAHRRERDVGLEDFYWCKDKTAAVGWRRVDREEWERLPDRKRARGNIHPTVKPIELCKYLATLILPPPGDRPRVLWVPFAGSGSEMIGGMLAGWDLVIGVEMEPVYAEMGRARCRAWKTAMERAESREVEKILVFLGILEKSEKKRQEMVNSGQLPLFEEI